MKIVFFGTSEVGVPILEAALKQHEVVAVVTSPDSPLGRKQVLTQAPIAELAAQHHIPTLKPKQVKNNPELLDQLQSFKADIFIVVSYGKILPAALLDIPHLKTLNVHFSLLPKYRGPAPIQYALLNGDTTTGTTIFILDELVDHGPILAQQTVAIAPGDNFESLAEKLSALSAQLLIDILPQYQSSAIRPQPQNHGEATFTKLINKEHGQIDWSKSAPEIYNQWRAFTPWPGIWTTWENQILKILECAPAPVPAEGVAPDLGLVPCANNTWLKLIAVQLASKTKTTMREFLNGHKNFRAADLL